MEFRDFLIKYAEIGIKGKNRYIFEDKLIERIREAMDGLEGSFTVSKSSGRIFVHAAERCEEEEAVRALQRVFGIAGICPILARPVDTMETLCSDAAAYMQERYPGREASFKVVVRRADKRFPVHSMDAAAFIGERVLAECPTLHVDVHQPDILLQAEIREQVYLYSDVLPGPGGMPVGTNGRAMLLLSGGIDSPVAGWMTARRGVELEAVYFHAPPYTSERAKQKVVDLARIVSGWAGPIRLHVINFTELQLYIYETCPHDELTILMRRYMMRIAEQIADEDGCQALITGESIGQVASQTMHSLVATNEVCRMPVFRPLIAFDKQEIVDRALLIGTYEKSIEPYEDCCTIFVAKHPVTRPKVEVIRRSESRLTRAEELMEEAVREREILDIR